MGGIYVVFDGNSGKNRDFLKKRNLSITICKFVSNFRPIFVKFQTENPTSWALGFLEIEGSFRYFSHIGRCLL